MGAPSIARSLRDGWESTNLDTTTAGPRVRNGFSRADRAHETGPTLAPDRPCQAPPHVFSRNYLKAQRKSAPQFCVELPGPGAQSIQRRTKSLKDGRYDEVPSPKFRFFANLLQATSDSKQLESRKAHPPPPPPFVLSSPFWELPQQRVHRIKQRSKSHIASRVPRSLHPGFSRADKAETTTTALQ